MKIEVGDTVIGTLLWGDIGSVVECVVVSTDAKISRDAIIVIYKGGRETMLEKSIIKVKSKYDQALHSKNSESI